MSTNEIIINCFRNPEKLINIELKTKETKNNKLKIICNDIELLEKNDNLYIINSLSPNEYGSNIIHLILKNINLDASKSLFHFTSLKTLSLNNSILILSQSQTNNFENLDSLNIKGDIKNIKQNLSNLQDNKILNIIKELTIKIISKSSSKINIFTLIKSFEVYITQIKNGINFYFKGLLADLSKDKIEKINNDIFSKIKKLYLFSLNKINIDSGKIIKDELIDKMKNLEELYLNENIICELGDKLKLVSYINNEEDINIDYNLYNINKLIDICLPICEYNKNKKTLLLYGEANMSFYNINNKKLLLDIIKNNHNGDLSLLSLCNFDMENIDYMNELINAINSCDKLIIKNLNIDEEFISIITNKNFFNTECISIENIIFVEEEVENKFYKIINSYNNCKCLKLISLEDISKYSDIIVNDNLNKLSLEEIYDMNYELLKELILKRNKYLSDISLKKLEIGDEDNKNIINDILIHCKNEIKKLKIIGEEFNFIYKDIQDKKIEFNKLQKLILHINKEEDNENENKEKDFISSDNDKIKYLENNYKLLNFNEIKKIDLEIFSINLNDKVKIMNLYKNLYEIY